MIHSEEKDGYIIHISWNTDHWVCTIGKRHDHLRIKQSDVPSIKLYRKDLETILLKDSWTFDLTSQEDMIIGPECQVFMNRQTRGVAPRIWTSDTAMIYLRHLVAYDKMLCGHSNMS